MDNVMMDSVATPTNDGAVDIDFQQPYVVNVKIKGTSAFLFHRWNCDAVAEKARAAKGSKSKKEDNVESYVYRDSDGGLAVPAEYLRMAVINAAKFRQDPRSPRKSAMDLFKAGIVSLHELMPLGRARWDYLDRRKVSVQRNGLTRIRPALNAGYELETMFQVLTPEYIFPDMLNDMVQMAGRLIGIGDFRPTFGRFQVVKFEVIS